MREFVCPCAAFDTDVYILNESLLYRLFGGFCLKKTLCIWFSQKTRILRIMRCKIVMKPIVVCSCAWKSLIIIFSFEKQQDSHKCETGETESMRFSAGKPMSFFSMEENLNWATRYFSMKISSKFVQFA